MDYKAMANEIEEMDRRLALIRSQRFKKVLLFDNAASHQAKVTTDKPAQSRFNFQYSTMEAVFFVYSLSAS
ncbi:unnamed protein product [Heligmosomoides polygyrus]|uniref:DDE-1 domain-containing protein n=1 Tax=Heligmosomoides polygyrus TaxID=6339 RepID=A0A183F7M1_HELPZ|nr:unnamed protein product [Heligmosomoides polygyrus]